MRRVLPPAGIAALMAMVTACSSLSGLTGGSASAPAAATPASTDGSFTSRVKSFFTGGSGGSLGSPAPSTTGAGTGTAPEIDCPGVEYRQGAATWAVNAAGAENSAMSLRYQASFIQTARECIVNGSNLTIKVGVQGRIVVGPAGGPGSLNIPLRYALVREGLHPKTLWTKFFSVPVSIPAGELNLPWIHVEEEMTVPRPSADELEAYVIYIGFDPESATSAKPRAAGKPKTARAR